MQTLNQGCRVRRQVVSMYALVAIIIIALFSQQTLAQFEIAATQPRDVAWSPDGEKVAIGYQSGVIQIVVLGVPEANLELQGHTGAVISLAWSSNGRFLVSGGLEPDNTVRIWDTLSGTQVQIYGGFGFSVLSVAWKPESEQIVAVTAEGRTNQGNAIIIDFEIQETTMASFGTVSDVQWSPDRTLIAMTGIEELRIYDAANFQLLSSYPVPRDSHRVGEPHLVILRWSIDGNHIAGGMGDGRILLWDLEDPQPIYTLEGHNYRGEDRFIGYIYDLRFDDTDETLTSISGDGTIRMWSLANGTLISEEITNLNYAAAFSPTGDYLALGVAQLPANQEQTLRSTTVEVLQTFADNTIQLVDISSAVQTGQ